MDSSQSYVAILILMEDALRRPVHYGKGTIYHFVAILILMEDALRLLVSFTNSAVNEMKSRNPYFNGRCLKTWHKPKNGLQTTGLSRNPYFNGRCLKTNFQRWFEPFAEATVAILILMEDALRQAEAEADREAEADGRNPYFNGRCLKT